VIGTASTLILLLAAQQPDPETGRQVSPLREFVTMTLAADRQTYYRGERMRLTVAVRNTSDQAVAGYFELAPGLGLAQVFYKADAGEFRELQCFLSPRGSFGLTLRSLGVGEEISEEVDVSVATLDPPTLLLDRLGGYEFRVVFDDGPRDRNARLESNVVSVEVVEAPASEREAQAAYTPTLAYLAQVPSGPDAFVTPESMAEAAAFVERYRQSRYAGPVKDGLLKWLEYRTGTQRATSEEAALHEKLLRATDTTPPELNVEASPATLWPPNHKLVRVLTTVSVSDDEDPSPVVKLESITCDDGCVPAQDIAGAELGTDDREFQLRAERKGSGSGRTYSITYSATDASGNRTLAGATVAVPHDQGK
jgi:hypothetical protein